MRKALREHGNECHCTERKSPVVLLGQGFLRSKSQSTIRAESRGQAVPSHRCAAGPGVALFLVIRTCTRYVLTVRNGPQLC